MQHRLEMAQAELQRKRVENSRVAAELGAAHMAAASATRMALENLAVIEAQIGVLSAAAGDAKLERARQPAELPIAVWIDVASAFLWQKALLESEEVDGWRAQKT